MKNLNENKWAGNPCNVCYSIILFIMILFGLSSTKAQWIQTNSTFFDSGVLALSSNGNNLYASNWSYQIFHSSNYGNSWIPMVSLPGRVVSFAFSGNIIYAGSWGFGVFNSTDNGESWIALNNGLTDLSIGVVAVNGNKIFAGHYYGLAVSTNNGQSWTDVNVINGHPVNDIAINGNNIFAASYGGGIFLSTNNGDSWVERNNGLSTLFAVCLAYSNDNIIAATGGLGSGVYISSNNGGNWTNIGLSGIRIRDIVTSENNIFVGCDNGVVLSTNNGGKLIIRNQGFIYGNDIVCLLIVNNYIFSGTWYESLWRRSLSEITWENLIVNGDFTGGNTGFFSQYVYCNTNECVGLGGPLHYAVGQDARFFNGIWNGKDHTTGSGNFLIAEAAIEDNIYVWKQTIPVNINSCYTFSFWLSSMEYNTSSDYPAEIKILINGIQAGHTMVAPRDTNTWAPNSIVWNSGSDTTCTIEIVDLKFNSYGHGFGIDDISFIEGDNNYSIYGPVAIPVDDSGKFYVSSANTGNWNIVNMFGTQAYIQSDSNGDSVIVSAGNHPGRFVLYYEDTDNNILCTHQVYVDYVLPVELASYTSTINQRNVTLNWVTSLETNNSGFDIERKSVTFDWSNAGFVAGNGTVTYPVNYSFTDRDLASGVYSYRLKQIDINGNFHYFNLNNEVIIGIPSKFEVYQNYPNPFNPSTKISFDLPVDSKVNVTVFDLTGKKIVTLVDEVKTAGYYTDDFNASNLSSGIYFYRVSAGNYTATKKMMLIR